MRTILAIVISGLFNSQAHAQANLFTLGIEDFPAATLSECTRSAKSISARLAELSGVESYGQQCTPDRLTARTFDISVSYLAENRVSAVDASDASYASYPSGAACLADLTRQVDMLEAMTKLPVLYSYCTREGSLRMLAIGDSEIRRQIFSAMVDSTPTFAQIYQHEALSKKLFDVLLAEGYVVSRATFSQSSLSLYYYSTQELPFGFANEPRFESETLCHQRADYVADLFEPRADVLFQFCARTDGLGQYGRTLYTFGLQKDATLPSMFGELDLGKIKSPPDQFQTRSACEGDLQRILTVYRDRLGIPARDALCSLKWLGNGVFEALIFR